MRLYFHRCKIRFPHDPDGYCPCDGIVIDIRGFRLKIKEWWDNPKHGWYNSIDFKHGIPMNKWLYVKVLNSTYRNKRGRSWRYLEVQYRQEEPFWIWDNDLKRLPRFNKIIKQNANKKSKRRI